MAREFFSFYLKNSLPHKNKNQFQDLKHSSFLTNAYQDENRQAWYSYYGKRRPPEYGYWPWPRVDELVAFADIDTIKDNSKYLRIWSLENSLY
jgi:hypothetical protein